MLSTRTWLPVTALVSGRSTYVQCFNCCLTRSSDHDLQILKVVEIEKPSDVKRPYIQQLIKKNLKFPLPHRVPKASAKKVFAPHRPSTFA